MQTRTTPAGLSEPDRPAAARANAASASAELEAALLSDAPALRPCLGFSLSELEPVAINYPYARHSGPMRWTVPNDQGVVFALGEAPCCGVLSAEMTAESCDSCSRLAYDGSLLLLIKIALDEKIPASRCNDIYLNFTQMQARKQLAPVEFTS